MTEPLLVLENIVKNYGAIQALRGISFLVRRGEVIALLGDNGAGKICATTPQRGQAIEVGGRKNCANGQNHEIGFV